MRQLAATKKKTTKLYVWDARSTEMSTDDLYSWGADKVFRSNEQIGDGENRTLQFYHFLEHETDELLYCIDNDALHDPQWERRLMTLYRTHASIVCLFNSNDHATIKKTPMYPLPHGSTIVETKDVVFRRTCGGISFLVSRQLLERNFKGSLKYPVSYDWLVPTWDRHVCVSRESYVAHLDFRGIHSQKSPQNKDGVDMGLNPTPRLKKICKPLIAALSDPTHETTTSEPG
jgi:hypothetical protein